MEKSLEYLNNSRDTGISKKPEITTDHENKPESFTEHMEELKKMLVSPPTNKAECASNENTDHERNINEARNAVLEIFDKNDNETDNSRGIHNCRNRIFRSEFGPSYNDNPNTFRTNESSVYRITGIDQIADIINCGYVRPKEGKVKGGHENEVFWSVGGDKLNFIDKRPILETSLETVKDGQVGALSLDDLSAIWIFNAKSGKRENKIDTIKSIKRFLDKNR